jgi:hypothetical protein
MLVQPQPPSRIQERIQAPVSGNLPAKTTEADKTVASQTQTPISRMGSTPASASIKPSEPAPSRTSHESGPSAQSIQLHHPFLGQAGNSTALPSTLFRDLSSTHGGTGPTNATARNSTTATLPSKEPFAALDAATGPGTPAWVHASSRRAEAGFEDPSLGWVGIRADASSGQVHATLLPGSSDAAQSLDGHLPGLHAYLADVHTPVASLTLATPESRESAFSTEQNQGEGMNQGTNQNAGQGGASESASHPQPASPSTASASSQDARGTPAIRGNQAPETYARSGAHISVIA